MGFDLQNDKHELIEKILLAIFFFLVLYVRLAQPFDGKISHDYPVFYSANDAFQGISLTDETKASGTPLYSPTYNSAGFEKAINVSPPLLPIYTAMLSIITKIEVYDAMYFLVAIFSVLAALGMYLIIRRQSRNIAILSLPFMLGVFSFSFDVIYPFGIWWFVIGSSFAIAALYVLNNISAIKYPAILLGLFLAGSALAHTPQAIFITGFIAVYLILRFILHKRIELSIISRITKAYAIMIALSVAYLRVLPVLFKNKGYTLFTVSREYGMAPGKEVYLSYFDYTLFFFALGLMLSAIIFSTHKKSDSSLSDFLGLKGKSVFFILIAGYFLLIGYTNYIGFSERAWQLRTFWPVYLSPVFALGLLFILKKIKRDINLFQVSVISIIFLLFFFNAHYGKLSPQGIMDKETWEGIIWIRGNTLQNASAFYFYTPLLFTTQSLYYTQRMSYAVNFEDFVDGIKNQKIKPEYRYGYMSENINAYGVGILTIKTRSREQLQPREQPGYYNMNYYIFTISALGDQPVLIQYNLAIRDMFLKNNMTEVYNNGRISILKNNVVAK